LTCLFHTKKLTYERTFIMRSITFFAEDSEITYIVGWVLNSTHLLWRRAAVMKSAQTRSINVYPVMIYSLFIYLCIFTKFLATAFACFCVFLLVL